MDTSTLDPSEKEEMVLDAIDQTRGRFFGITFRKKDGSIRHMNARTHPDDDPPHWNPEEQGMKYGEGSPEKIPSSCSRASVQNTGIRLFWMSTWIVQA